MKMRWVIWFIWSTLGVALVAAVGAAIYLSVLLRGDALRQRAETALSRTVSRPVSIGELQLSVWAGRATAERFSIAEDPRFGSEPFLSAAKVRIGIELLPLLMHREVRFDSFVLEHPAIHLVRDASGTWNYATLGRRTAPSPATEEQTRGLPALVASEIALKDGEILVRTFSADAGKIAFRDRGYGAIDLSVRHFSMQQPFSFHLSAGLPAGGKVEATGTAGPLQWSKEGEIPVSAHVQAKQLDLDAAGLTSASSAVSGQIGEVTFDLAWREQAFHVAHLDIRRPRLWIAAKTQTTEPAQRPIKKRSVWNGVLERLVVQQATIQDGTLTVVRRDGRVVDLRHVDVDLACWCENTWSPFRVGMSLGSAGVRVEGRLLVPRRKLENLVRRPAYQSRLEQENDVMGEAPRLARWPQEMEAQFRVNRLDLASSGLLSPESVVSGLVDTNGHVQTRVGDVRVSGTARLVGLKLAKNGQPSPKAVLANFDVTQERRGEGQRATGTIQHAAFGLGAATVEVSGSYVAGGSATLVNLSARGDAMPIDQIEAFLPTVGVQLPQGSRLSGGTLSTSLAIAGVSSNLVISGPVRLVNTHLMGFDLGSKLSSLSKFTGGRLGSTGSTGTSIHSLSLLLHTGGGQVETSNIVADVAGLGSITGAGSVGEGATLHYGLTLKLDELASGAQSNADVARDFAKNLPGPWASRALGAINYLSKGPMKNGIPILIGGTAHHPTVTPNIGAMLPPNKPQR